MTTVPKTKMTLKIWDEIKSSIQPLLEATNFLPSIGQMRDSAYGFDDCAVRLWRRANAPQLGSYVNDSPARSAASSLPSQLYHTAEVPRRSRSCSDFHSCPASSAQF